MNLTMPGLSSAKALTGEELIRIIDQFDLKDYALNRLIAPLWQAAPRHFPLVIDCTTPTPGFHPGAYILNTMPELLLEGILIAQQLLEPSKISLLLPEGMNLPDCFTPFNITVTQDAPVHGLCHSAEIFITLARLFRREGADRRIFRISAPGHQTFYAEFPLSESLYEITRQYEFGPLTGARIGGDHGYAISATQFHQCLRQGFSPMIDFF